MATKVIHTIFLLKRGTNEQWIKHNPVLRKGEPGFVIDRNILKIGDGVTNFLDLPKIGGEGGGTSDLPTYITNPQEGQILVYDATAHAWRNIDLTANASIIWDDGLGIAGFDEAPLGYVPSKANGGIEWIEPADSPAIEEAVERAEGAAIRANNSAIVAGNAAADALESAREAAEKAQTVRDLVWTGTMEEYNALEHIYDDTIYYILHD